LITASQHFTLGPSKVDPTSKFLFW